MVHNLSYWIETVFLLFGILAACQVFTNAIENLGDKLNLNHEFTGSILAAVGTALPETILPLVAIYMANQADTGTFAAKNDIAIGAIVGAPFMLTSLAMLLLGLSLVAHKKKRRSSTLNVNYNHLRRDLIFFLICFGLALLAALINSPSSSLSKVTISAALIILYAIYLYRTYKASKDEIGDEEDETPRLYLLRVLKSKVKEPSMSQVLSQTIFGLVGIVFFAHHFVHTIEHIAEVLKISPLVLSLIISPIATELPEKVNSWIWSSQGKDTLAMGNLSGAMVFQSVIPCIIGILLTPWVLTKTAIVCSTLALVSGSIMLINLMISKKISYKTLMFCGSLYFLYLILAFS